MSDRLDLPEDTLAQVDEYLGHVEEGRWVCVWRDAYGIEYGAAKDMETLHSRVRELEAQAARLVEAELAHRQACARLGGRYNDAHRGESVDKAEMKELHGAEVEASIERDDVMDAFIVFVTGKPLLEDVK